MYYKRSPIVFLRPSMPNMTDAQTYEALATTTIEPLNNFCHLQTGPLKTNIFVRRYALNFGVHVAYGRKKMTQYIGR